MKGTEPHPLQGAANPYGQKRFRDKRYCCIFILRRSSGNIPRPMEQNISRIATHCVLWRIPPARTAIFALPRPFDCCFALVVIYGGCKGSFWLWRVAMAGSKMRINSESEAGSFSLRGRPRRGQIEAGRETLTAYEGVAVVAGPPAGGGWRRRRRDDGCTYVSPRRGGLLYTSTAPQRRRHCGIAPAALLVCSLAASDGNDHVSICSGCADLDVWRRRTFMVVIELFCLCEIIFACCVRYLTDGRNTPGTKSVPKVSPRIGTIYLCTRLTNPAYVRIYYL